jgi:hypothetical protein
MSCATVCTLRVALVVLAQRRTSATPLQQAAIKGFATPADLSGAAVCVGLPQRSAWAIHVLLFWVCFVLAETGGAAEGADVGLVHRFARMLVLVERGGGGGGVHASPEHQGVCLLCAWLYRV